MKKIHLTLLDDDKNYLAALTISLEREFETTAFSQPEEALSYIQNFNTDGILLDLHLDDASGFEICEKIKKLKSDVPVFFLTADKNIECITQGFESGGIDYFDKAVPVNELITRVKQRIKKTYEHLINHSQLECGDLRIDLKAKLAYHQSRELVLTPKEYELLKVFMELQNQVISKQQIYDLLWANTHVHINNIDTHIFNLRKKLKSCFSQISTVKSRGFLLRSSSVL